MYIHVHFPRWLTTINGNILTYLAHLKVIWKVWDPTTNLHYDNLLYAQIDAVYAAIKAMGHTGIEVRISETGWPSKGDPNEVGASPENAAAYNGNLLERVHRQEGTPANPKTPIDVYLFALFNENLKPGPTSERNYGLYYPDESPVYSIGLQGNNNTKFVTTTNYSEAAPRKFVDLQVYIILSMIVYILLSSDLFWRTL